jgi:hypothetical protein
MEDGGFVHRIVKHIGAFALGIGFVMSIASAQPRHLECTDIADLVVNPFQLQSFNAPGEVRSFPLLAIVGLAVPIDGSSSRLRIYKPDACATPAITSALPHFVWTLEGPNGSKTLLENTNSLRVSFTPDIPGDYVVHLVGCPNDTTSKRVCTVRLVAAYTSTGKPIVRAVQLGPVEKVVKVTVSARAQLPPLYRPGNLNDPSLPALTTLPTSPQHYDLARSYCNFGTGIEGHPEWYTTSVWKGPTPAYEAVEGRVYRSNIAGTDYPFTHIANDHNAMLEVDPSYRRLLIDDGPEDKDPDLLPFGGLEIEWEFLNYPDVFRPLEGDRMSVLGYHVVDCGHTPRTEMHPPIGVAVHRPRAVMLPTQFQYEADKTSGQPIGAVRPIGSNVYVPGIVTDIWISLNGGEILNGGSRGLHQPTQIVVNGLTLAANPSVLKPTTKGVTFQFKVYLPPSPTYVLGFNKVIVPPFDAALFVEVQNHPRAADLGASTALTIKEVERHLGGAFPYLAYSIDLSALSPGERFAKRIVAGWVYPDLDGNNFGLRAYRVKLEQMKVLDTGDVSSGDWKLWATIPSVDAPWTRLIECRSCIDEMTYASNASIWERGAMDTAGHLMGEVLLFQPTEGHYSQDALLRFTGYDNDWLETDPIGNAANSVGQLGRYSVGTTCDDCPSFNLVYDVERGITPVTEVLAPEAKAFFQALLIHPKAVAAVVMPTEGELYSSAMTSRRRNILLKAEDDDTKEIKEFLEPATLRIKLQAQSVAQKESLVKDVRRRMLDFLGPNPSAKHRHKIAADLQKLKVSVPAGLYKKYLCDLEAGKACP